MKLFRIGLVALVACSDATTTPITQLNLDRPIDISFACYGGLRLTEGGAATLEQPIVTIPHPIQSCEFRSGNRATTADPAPAPPGQEDLGPTSRPGAPSWIAFVLQSGTGTVAVATFDTKPSSAFGGNDVRVLDADPLTPGKNSISVGEDPVAIVTDRVGCFGVVANAGSCDLSTIDIATAVEATTPGHDVTPVVTRVDVKNAAGEVIRARPAAMKFEPPSGVIGTACPLQPTGLAYIAYPSCHLVAGVDVATGTIVTSIKFNADETVTLGDGNVSCPAECDGAPATPGVRPVSLDIERDARTGRVVLAVGADNSNVLTAYELDTQSSLPLSAIPPIVLEDPNNRLGLTSLAISPMIGMGGTMGSLNGILDDGAPGGDHQFIYAVATDGSVRVADITGAPRECETNVDPRYLRSFRDVDQLACMGVGAASTPPRRAGARGPGIELIGDAVPTSVDVAKVDKIEMDARPDALRMVGYFGLISAANGQVFVFNVDNDDYPDYVPSDEVRDVVTVPVPLTLPHQLRDSLSGRSLVAEEGDGASARFVCDDPGPNPSAAGGNTGGPRLLGSIVTSVPAGSIAIEKSGGLPSIRQVFCDAGEVEGEESGDRPVSELFFSAPLDVRAEVFPDLRALRADETWTLTYEGSLSADKVDQAIDGPAVRTSQMVIDSFGLRLEDATRPFCEAGVEPYDIVQLRGCDPSIGDAGCPIGYTCYVHPQSQVTGIGACMLIDEAERLSTTCKAFLTSVRRYTVGRTKTGTLQLLPRKAVLRTTPITGCDTDEQCEALADYAVQNTTAANPGDPEPPTDPKTWRCQPDPDRRPVATGKRCLLTCDDDTQCSFGTTCQFTDAAAPQKGYCMEGVVPPQSCINAPQRYELRAGEAFAVLGTRQGYMHPIIADAGDVCVRDPNAKPTQVGRIPLDAPDCDPTADPVTGRKLDGSYDANPCKVTVDETEYQLNYIEGTCTLADPNETISTRPATALRFRNRAMQLTLVDPTYQGDLMCNGDRKGTLTNVPIVMPGYSLSFRQTAGFTALTIPAIQPALPIKVLRGPTESFWIIDEGDFLSTSLGQASTRGNVFRVESRAISVINVLDK